MEKMGKLDAGTHAVDLYLAGRGKRSLGGDIFAPQHPHWGWRRGHGRAGVVVWTAPLRSVRGMPAILVAFYPVAS